MTILIASPTLFVRIFFIIGSLSSFLLSLFKLFLITSKSFFILINKSVYFLIFLSLLIFKFLQLFFKNFRFLLIKLCNLFLSKHATIECKFFLKWVYYFQWLRICFQYAIWLLFDSMFKFFYYFFDFIPNIIQFLILFPRTEILIIFDSFLNLIFTKTKHFLNLSYNLISTIITHHNRKQMWIFWINNIKVSMINCLSIYSINFFQFLFHFIGFFFWE